MKEGTDYTMKRMDLVAAVRHHARDNYNVDGWDYVVECFEDSDILERIEGAETAAQAINMIREVVRRMNDRRADIEAEVF